MLQLVLVAYFDLATSDCFKHSIQMATESEIFGVGYFEAQWMNKTYTLSGHLTRMNYYENICTRDMKTVKFLSKNKNRHVLFCSRKLKLQTPMESLFLSFFLMKSKGDNTHAYSIR